MISLARHIELLLLEHDCVIVPGLGGFIANHADARYSEEDEHLFLPPYRTIGFNQQLQVNDGLLVQSYMTAYDTSYPFANLQMEKDLENMMYELEMKGEYVLENIGVLKKGLNQNITFISPETGALTPALYGLYSYDIKSLKSVIKEREIEANLQAASAMQLATNNHTDNSKAKKTKQKDVVIRLNRHWLDFGISVAAAVLLFFCFSYPAMKNINTETDTVVAAFPAIGDATITTKSLPSKVQPTKPARPVTAQPVASDKGNESKIVQNETPATESASMVKTTETEHQTANVKEVQTDEHKFAIVLASYISQKNAEKFINTLSEEGYKEGRYVKNGKTSRILYSNYVSEEAAQNALKELRQENPAFAEAWVLAL